MPSSLKVYRRAIMRELAPNGFGVHTTTSLSATTTTLVCSTLIDSEAETSRFAGAWAFITSGAGIGQQRRITRSGFDKTTGTITLTAGLASAASSGTEFETLTVMPAIQTDERVGVREIINDVLSEIPPIDLLPVTGSTGLALYSLSTLYPWLTEKDQIIGIYFQDTGQDYPHEYPCEWRWQYDADEPKLLLPGEPFVTGDTFYVKARRPADSWIETNGTWAADTNGLQSDSDRALPLVPVVRAMALAKIYRLLGAAPGPDEYAVYYREREAHWAKKAYALRYWGDQKSEEDRRPQFRMVQWSPFGGRFSRRSY